MGADIKALRGRIKSVDSTLHLTKAMGLVASSKIRRAADAMKKSRDYVSALQELVAQLAKNRECQKSPFMRQTEGADMSRTRIIVIAGDRGLAGGYNANIFRLAANYTGARFIPIGKRAYDRFAADKSVPFESSERYPSQKAAALAQTLCDDFAAGEYDRLGILHTTYVSMMTQTAAIDWILPLTRPDDDTPGADILFEPDEVTILGAVMPEYVAGMLMGYVRESFASEVTARRMAMDSAGKNATAMIEELQLKYNRARQGAITQEITEIVAGAGSGE